MVRSTLIVGTLLLLWASPTLAEEDDGGCVHNRKVHPEGYELCENGMLRRCEEGAWSDIGRCDREATEAPRSGGGDELEPEEQGRRR
jgi:hypothetical protein